MSAQTWSVRHNHVRGQCTIASTGITFKSSAGLDEKASVTSTNLAESKVSLLILGPRTRQLRITRPDGTHVRFDGFKRDDAENIISLFQAQFSVTVTTEQPASSGKNFGDLILNNDQVILTIDDKIAMEMRTEDIGTTCMILGGGTIFQTLNFVRLDFFRFSFCSFFLFPFPILFGNRNFFFLLLSLLVRVVLSVNMSETRLNLLSLIVLL